MNNNNILDGTALANQIKDALRAKIALMQQPPGLAVILVGEDPSSQIYVSHKQRACEQVGIISQRIVLPKDTTEQTLLDTIKKLNADDSVHGILVQLPLAKQISADRIVDTIDPSKDVDGFHAVNLGRLVQRRPNLRPCTPYGIIRLLSHYNVAITGKHAVVIGASNIVGRPMALEFLLEGATTTICHRFTQNLERHVRQADILVVATGKYGLIKTDWVSEKAVVIDVGMHRTADGKLHGDCDFASLQGKVQWITPVPGGVGPMTVAMLLENTVSAAK